MWPGGESGGGLGDRLFLKKTTRDSVIASGTHGQLPWRLLEIGLVEEFPGNRGRELQPIQEEDSSGSHD